jgi:hypothetical protein
MAMMPCRSKYSHCNLQCSGWLGLSMERKQGD